MTFEQRQRYLPVGVDLTQDEFDRISNYSVKKNLRAVKKKIQSMEIKVSKAIESINDFSFEELQIALYGKSKMRNSSTEVYDLFNEVI